jgi:pimeloyl-ACP methyl ester carboxylesterase
MGAVVRGLITRRRSAPPVPYLLADMAADVVGLLDHLSIDRAHLVGVSMGGMIGQIVAAKYADRTLTLTSIMSNTGELDHGQPTAAALERLLIPPPTDKSAYVDHSAATWRVLAPHVHFDEDAVRQRAAAAYDRAFYPQGTGRQLAAVFASGDRVELLRQIECPTLVIHGRQDPLVQPSGGKRTAALVPGARLVLIDQMGHDLPRVHWPFITGTILAHTATSTTGWS